MATTRTYDLKLQNVCDWVGITNYHWHRLKGLMYDDKEFWADTLHAMTKDDWWDWVDIAPSLRIQYQEEWRRYPKLDEGTEAIKKSLMLGKPVTRKNGVGKNFEAFRLLMNIKDFFNDLAGEPTQQYKHHSEPVEQDVTQFDKLFG